MENWDGCAHVLVVRADHMGDLLMSAPAISNLKNHLKCRITVLTSTRGAAVATLLPQIDEVMVYDVPWVQLNHQQPVDFHHLVELIRDRDFDACVVFTVYSQNPMPAILLAYLANIPRRLAYCRENPYHLLTEWVPDQEPYHLIKHQVSRDLSLVEAIGVKIGEKAIKLQLPPEAFTYVAHRLSQHLHLDSSGYYVLHPGVSELKRRFPKSRWIALARALREAQALPVLVSGGPGEEGLAEEIAAGGGEGCYSVAGLFSIPQYAALLADARALVSVNTGAVHLAAAVQTPVVVLHAETNPQHGPWGVSHKVLPFSIPVQMKSKNAVVRWVDDQIYQGHRELPETKEILEALVAIT